MRWIDGPRAEAEVFVNAMPSQVWPVVSDIELSARFSPELQRVEWLDGATGPASGARFAGYNQNEHLGDWRSVSEIVEFTPEHHFAWAVVAIDTRLGELSGTPTEPIATWRFTLTPTDGGTRVVHNTSLGPARSAMNLALERHPDHEEKIIDTRIAEIQAAMQMTVEGVRELVEA